MSLLTNNMLDEISSIPFRKIKVKPQKSIVASDLCYQLDVDLDIEDSYHPYPDLYPMLVIDSKYSIFNHIKRSKHLGLRSFNLHIICSKTSSVESTVKKAACFIKSIRDEYGDSITLLIDLVGIAFNSDCSWGVKTQNKIDSVKTLNLISEASKLFIDAGADVVLSIGRINFEVSAIKLAFMNSGEQDIKIASFSTNSSVSMAYFNPESPDPDRSQVDQLLSPFNIDEMVLRSLLDITEGSSVIYQKPMSHSHVTERLRTLLDHKELLDLFILQQLAHLKDSLVISKRIENILSFTDFAKVKLGGYSVSGDSYNVLDMVRNHGVYMAYKFLKERYLIFKAIAGNYFENIIDRNALWFLEQNKKA